MVWKGKVALGALLAVACIAGSAQATVVAGFNPTDSSVLLGDTVDVQIVADVTDVSIFGWGLDVDYDDQLVELENIAIGPLWDDVGATGDGDGLAGSTFPDSISGTGLLLATLTFRGVGLGVSPLELSHDNPPDLTEGFPLDPTGFETDETFLLGSIEVTPEPASLALLMLGGLAVIRRR